MLERKSYPIDKIYVPVKRAKSLDPERAMRLAEDILENGQAAPIQLRTDGERFVLIEGLHRLEAMRALGEETIDAFLVSSRLK